MRDVRPGRAHLPLTRCPRDMPLAGSEHAPLSRGGWPPRGRRRAVWPHGGRGRRGSAPAGEEDTLRSRHRCQKRPGALSGIAVPRGVTNTTTTARASASQRQQPHCTFAQPRRRLRTVASPGLRRQCGPAAQVNAAAVETINWSQVAADLEPKSPLEVMDHVRAWPAHDSQQDADQSTQLENNTCIRATSVLCRRSRRSARTWASPSRAPRTWRSSSTRTSPAAPTASSGNARAPRHQLPAAAAPGGCLRSRRPPDPRFPPQPPPIESCSLDTGRLNPETYQLFDKVEKHYGIRIEYTFPEAQEVQELVRTKGLFSFYEDGHTECCRIRKVSSAARWRWWSGTGVFSRVKGDARAPPLRVRAAAAAPTAGSRRMAAWWRQWRQRRLPRDGGAGGAPAAQSHRHGRKGSLAGSPRPHSQAPACLPLQQVKPLRKQLKGLKAWITGQRKDQSPGTRQEVPTVQVSAPTPACLHPRPPPGAAALGPRPRRSFTSSAAAASLSSAPPQADGGGARRSHALPRAPCSQPAARSSPPCAGGPCV